MDLQRKKKTTKRNTNICELSRLQNKHTAARGIKMIALDIDINTLMTILANAESTEEELMGHIITTDELLEKMAEIIDDWYINAKKNICDYETKTHRLGYLKEILKIKICKFIEEDNAWENIR